jgi:hypothetical protein
MINNIKKLKKIKNFQIHVLDYIKKKGPKLFTIINQAIIDGHLG